MKQISSFVVACMLAAGASFAANDKPQEQQAPAASTGMAPIVYVDTLIPS